MYSSIYMKRESKLKQEMLEGWLCFKARTHLSSFCHQSICCLYFSDDSDAYHQSDSPTKAPPLRKEITDPVSFSVSTFFYVFMRWNDMNNQRLSQSPLQARGTAGKEAKWGLWGRVPTCSALFAQGKKTAGSSNTPPPAAGESYKKEKQLQLLFHASRDLVS